MNEFRRFVQLCAEPSLGMASMPMTKAERCGVAATVLPEAARRARRVAPRTLAEESLAEHSHPDHRDGPC